MLDNNTRRVDHRIVNLSKPYVRLIVRGKAGARVEFGAKLLVAVEKGHSFLVASSWDNFNEGSLFIEGCEGYLERNGVWPEVVCSDMIFRTRANLSWCRQRGIRLSGPSLGRPPLDQEKLAERKRLERLDASRRNEVEGIFGEGKRKYGLDLIRGKLAETSESLTVLRFMIMNLRRMLRLFSPFFISMSKRFQIVISRVFLALGLPWAKKKLGGWMVRKASGTDVPDAQSGFRAINNDVSLSFFIFSLPFGGLCIDKKRL